MNDKLTAVQIADELGVTSVTVRNWIRDGKLMAYRIGGRLFVRRADLERFLSRPVYPREQVSGGGEARPA